jgi:hypothetical protein
MIARKLSVSAALMFADANVTFRTKRNNSFSFSLSGEVSGFRSTLATRPSS